MSYCAVCGKRTVQNAVSGYNTATGVPVMREECPDPNCCSHGHDFGKWWHIWNWNPRCKKCGVRLEGDRS